MVSKFIKRGELLGGPSFLHTKTNKQHFNSNLQHTKTKKRLIKNYRINSNISLSKISFLQSKADQTSSMVLY